MKKWIAARAAVSVRLGRAWRWAKGVFQNRGGRAWRWTEGFFRKNGGRMAYYGLVVLALCAIARAAELHRGGRNLEAEQMVLSAADIQLPAEPEEAAPALWLPEGMEMVRGFSSAPEWRQDLELWEAHPAVDYAGGDGGVDCLCGGVVRTVGESGVYGGFVEIDCDGMLMRYASVAPAESIAPGMELEAGENLGVVDASMPGEASLGAHLHLELYVDGEAVDFAARAVKKPSGAD